MDPVGSQVLPGNLLHMDSSLKGSTDPARSLFQHRLATGPQPPSGIHLLWHGVLHSLQVHLCSTVDLLGLSTTHIWDLAQWKAERESNICTVWNLENQRELYQMHTSCNTRGLLGDKVVTPCSYVHSNLKRKRRCTFEGILWYMTFHSYSLRQDEFKGNSELPVEATNHR